MLLSASLRGIVVVKGLWGSRVILSIESGQWDSPTAEWMILTFKTIHSLLSISLRRC